MDGGRIRVGLIGAGSWANAFHLPALAARSDVTIVAVADPDSDRARRAATRFGAERWSADWTDVASADLDAVILASPPHAHEEQATLALASGAHVLCEKPFSTTAAAAWRMVSAAERADRVLIVGFGWNYMPLVQRARAWVADGRLGDIEFVSLAIRASARGLLTGTGAYQIASADVDPRPETFVRPEISGGGAVAVTMSHAFAAMLFLTRLEAVDICSRSWDGPLGVDLHDAMVVGLANGAICSVSCASAHRSSPHPEWDVVLIGDRGQLRIDSAAGVVRFGSADGASVEADLPTDPGRYDPSGPLSELLAVAKGARVGDEGSAWLGARTVELVEAAIRSARSRNRESVASPARALVRGGSPR